ncbi:MAG TPA: TIGR04325 family methyltransferase [Bryobacteraceae bacterium]|jgi:putative methyltransferase (TIGR04325 family)|nr:TIGR04325 family methyltransferase [Bryobacteraceae bacterium]
MPTWREHLRLAQIYRFVSSFRSAFRGVYSTFEEARRAAPDHLKLGHDHPETAQTHRGYVDKLRLSDYAVLFWMARILDNSTSVFDLGGHIGVAYYAFRKYLHFNPNLHWTVCDVPQVVQSGREFAAGLQAAQLSFTTNFREASGTDILLTAGAVQYIETPLAEILASLARKPTHLLINRVPLSSGQDFVTLQRIGPQIHPYHVFRRDAFLDSLRGLGYRLVDSWEISETFCGSCVIPFHPDKTVEPYSGLYLRLESDETGEARRTLPELTVPMLAAP